MSLGQGRVPRSFTKSLLSDQHVVGVVWTLVYVDPLRTTVGEPKKECVERINLGVEEANREWGFPISYVKGQFRRFIPEERRARRGEDGDMASGQELD